MTCRIPSSTFPFNVPDPDRYISLCTSTLQVQQYLQNAMRDLTLALSGMANGAGTE